MNILIPMAGEGSRFSEKGYNIHKPLIPTIDYRTGEEIPMVIAATKDIPLVQIYENNIIYITREFHHNFIEKNIQEFFPEAQFITIDYLTDGQAITCLQAKHIINNNAELLISACDHGMIYDIDKFLNLKSVFDALIFTYTQDDELEHNPQAYGWVVHNPMENVTNISVKIPISTAPINDHAVVGTFWFKHGRDFVEATELMIDKNDRVNNEFYVDQAINHLINMGKKVGIFEINRYLGWGTPSLYENYQKTYKYWTEFYKIIKNNK